MGLINRIQLLATRIAQDIKALRDGKADKIELDKVAQNVNQLLANPQGTTESTTEKKYVYRTPKGASWMNGNSYFQLTRIGNLVVAGADGDSWATISITPPNDNNFNRLPKRESTVDGKGGTWLQINRPNASGNSFQSNYIIPEGFTPVKSTYGNIVNDNGIIVATVMFGDKENQRLIRIHFDGMGSEARAKFPTRLLRLGSCSWITEDNPPTVEFNNNNGILQIQTVKKG